MELRRIISQPRLDVRCRLEWLRWYTNRREDI